MVPAFFTADWQFQNHMKVYVRREHWVGQIGWVAMASRGA